MHRICDHDLKKKPLTLTSYPEYYACLCILCISLGGESWEIACFCYPYGGI